MTIADRTTLNNLTPNMDIGDVADPALRLAVFQYLFNLSDANYTYLQSLVTSGTLSPYPPAQYNKLINGNMDVWQVNTTFNSPSGYTADMFTVANLVDANIKVSRSTAIPNGKSKYSYRIEGYSGTSGIGSYSNNRQYLPEYLLYAGLTVTLSGWVRCDSGASFIPYIEDGVNTYTGNVVTSTDWVQFSITATLSAVLTQLAINCTFLRSGLAVGLGINFTQLQLTVSSSVLPYQPRGFAAEYWDCLDFYEKSYGYATPVGTASTVSGIETIFTASNTIDSAQRYGTVHFQKAKRSSPTIIIYPFVTPTNTFRVTSNAGTDLAALSGSIGFSSEKKFVLANISGGALTTTDKSIFFHYTADCRP